MATSKVTLKDIPGFGAGINENAAVRMVKLARPICKDCQFEFRNGRGWWDKCMERGHNPYFTVTEVPRTVPIVEENEQGENIVTGQKVVIDRTETLNVAQVALSERVNSGQGVERAIQRKGFKVLSDLGYAPVCQFRNCQNRVAVNTVYGDYCSENHARLIAADVEGVSIEALDMRKRRRQLRELDLYDRG